MPLLQQQRTPSPVPTMDKQIEESSVLETVLLETSYNEEFGSSQTEISKLPFSFSQFPLITSGMVSVPPLLDELTDSDSSFDSVSSSLSSQEFSEVLSKIHDTADTDIEVRLDDGDSFYTAIMTHHSSSSSLQDLPRKKVRFSSAEIREYDMIVGDHPGCASGLPVALDWKYNPNSTIVDLTTPLQHEESSRGPVQRLSLLQRMKLLKKFYKSSEDLWIAERERRKILEEEEAYSLQRVPTTANLCACKDSCDSDDGTVPKQQQPQRRVVQPSDVCNAMECLVEL